MGALDPSQVQQSSGIIPFETIAGNHPKFVQDKIVADVNQDAPSEPVIEPETNPTISDPVVTPPVGNPITPDPDPTVTPPLEDPSIPDPVVTPPVNDPSIPDVPQPIDGAGTGLTAEYFNNIDFTDLGLTRTDAAVDFKWRQGDSPDSAIEEDTFSVRWSGQIESLYSETYTFTTRSDDGVRLWVNGELLIDNWTRHSATENTGEITLEAGQKYDIQMEFFEGWGDAVAQLYWSSASQEREIIPASQLYSTANSTVQGDANNNVLTATGENDLIIGTQPLDTTPGQNEIDVLIGGDGRDTFVLGDDNRTFYDDGDIMLGGLDDYALIQGFKPVQGDRIQLHGSLDNYTLGESPTGLPSGTAIFHKGNGASELVAVVEDAKASDLSGNFTFV
ncbi:hypothetical protein IQ260_10360 [Leptolyngbya cf. ectocarpi LEGE 11479]|uniref:PA14 domain-containing protein n=1 Tax=Leptolyngbya cf. ectocarpi LEGE 11479 TaxID=1828722 RepID=A0A928X179_LEPEC|nr:PA14 domain-containing protein [Leptolyngbya ectocarpi]MBE9067057.1 hypothetical protein [Leptolyngbya cf. ectocarpi LEGE 11479]